MVPPHYSSAFYTQRYWIEHAYGEAKGELGLAHYEVPGRTGWHHHMAMVALAQMFTVKERIASEEGKPLLSTRDVVELLARYLPRRERTEKEIFRQMRARHRRREQASVAHAKRRSGQPFV
jgi:uncharacterized protein YjhX (UPF0386 family)